MAKQQDIAEHLDMTTRQVRNLLKSGVLPGARPRQGYDLDECRKAYMRYLRGQLSNQVKEVQGNEVDPMIDEKREQEEYRLIQEKRIGQQFKNTSAGNKLVPIGFAEFSLIKVGDRLSQILGNVPDSMRKKHPDLERRHLLTLSKEIARAQTVAKGIRDDLPYQLNDYFETI